ncbi:MAG: putative D-cysteine desulfhydrase [Ilumatobacteraceae bacterium]|nr:putative D-cysteine desulfhydrase [Ilumatobacteraceae bacterium]
MGSEERFEVIDHMCVGHTNNSHRNGHAWGAPTVWLTANVQFEGMPMGRLVTLPRADLATLPTPLERGPHLEAGPRLWVKRDDLTGLGVGGNKARKLEYLCGAALAEGADCLITVGAGQSNHCRMTAAAGARLGLETHLVLSGDRPDQLVGNQLLSHLFGAHLHFTGVPSANWGELEIAREALTEALEADGLHPHSIPIGGSTPVGALGYVAAFVETMEQCAALGIEPAAIVFTSSSGGTHAGLVAGLALWRSQGNPGPLPEVVAIGVAKGVVLGLPDIVGLANDALKLLGATGKGSSPVVTAADVEIDTRWIGEDYAIPTAAADDAIIWSARHGGWVLDRTYSGKGMAGMLGNAAEGRWAADADVIFIHTGGLPAVFAPEGVPDVAPAGELDHQLP